MRERKKSTIKPRKTTPSLFGKCLLFWLIPMAAYAQFGNPDPPPTLLGPAPPVGLAAGSFYHLIFVTEGKHDAMSTDIEVYNDFVNQEAEREGSLVADLDIDWRVIASTPTVSAKDNASIFGDVYHVNGSLVTKNNDLWHSTRPFSDDGLMTATGPYINQFGIVQAGEFAENFCCFYPYYAWTGTKIDGTIAKGHALGDLSPIIGTTGGAADPSWINLTWDGATTRDLEKTFYAISSLLIVSDEAISGDYNYNGIVEQGDLDLALINWGKNAVPTPPGWLSDPPTQREEPLNAPSIIGQLELDKVLLSWGNTRPVNVPSGSQGGVPEPSGLFIGATGGLLALLFRYTRR